MRGSELIKTIPTLDLIFFTEEPVVVFKGIKKAVEDGKVMTDILFTAFTEAIKSDVIQKN